MMEYVLILIILILGFLLYLKFENTNLEVTHYNIKSNKIPESFSGTVFVVIADLHNNSFGKNNDILIGEIDKINPSFIIIAGDLIVGKRSEDFRVAISLLNELVQRYPIYYGFGNHEQRVIPKGRYFNNNWKKYVEKLYELKIKLLDNESATITKGNDKIIINGLSIDKIYFRKKKDLTPMKEGHIENLIGKLNNKCYNIVIAHDPVYFEEYINTEADLILSGHIHGGIIRLPFLGGLISPHYELFPLYDSGKFQKKEQIMLVSRGLGTHTIKLRVFNRPELMAITLER